jgi:Na+-transporting methylmalonyl-CoA/oxaloacetate decarboxylase gamma subunit
VAQRIKGVAQMTYIITGLILIVLFLCLYILKLQGYRVTRMKPEDIPEKDKLEAQRKIEAFDKIMNYNLDLALKREQVM